MAEPVRSEDTPTRASRRRFLTQTIVVASAFSLGTAVHTSPAEADTHAKPSDPPAHWAGEGKTDGGKNAKNANQPSFASPPQIRQIPSLPLPHRTPRQPCN